MFDRSSSPDLRAFVIWVPKSFGSESAVAEAAATVKDPRARHYWDEGGHLMSRYSRLLALPEDAWDIFFIYERTARWDGPEPPKPDFLMHQLGPDVPGPPLDGARFASEALSRLR